MTTSLFLAKLSLMAVLAGYLPLFLGVTKGRRPLAVLLAASTAALLVFSGVAVGDAADLGALFAGRTAVVVGGALGALALLAGLTWLAWRFPAWALPAVVAVMPLRVPVPVGDRTAYLLLPLYFGTLAVLIAEVVIRDRLRPEAAGLPAALDRPRDPLRLSLAVFMALAGLSVFWAGSGWGTSALGPTWREEVLAGGLVELLAFSLPFGIVLMLVYRYVADGAGLRRLLLTVIGSGVVLAGIGIVQYPTRWLVFNRAGIFDDAELGNGFRVNSLFWDPNMFSRFLMVVLLLCIVLMVAVPGWRRRLAGASFLLAGANVLTLSRSGWLALGVGFLVFAFSWLGRRRGAYVAIAAVLLLVVGGGLLIVARDVTITRAKLAKPWGINKLTGGRLYLGEAALKMTADYPAGGVGFGSFSLAYPEYRNRHASKKLTESHTTPLTLLAELGPLGFVAFVAIVWAALDVAFRRRPRLDPSAPPRAGPAGVTSDDIRRLELLRAGLGAIVAAVVTHSLLYNAFFEDPYLWLTFGLLLACACRLTGWRPEESATSSGSDPGSAQRPADD